MALCEYCCSFGRDLNGGPVVPEPDGYGKQNITNGLYLQL